MSQREAGVKLTLNSGSFNASMQGVASEAKRTGSSIKSSLNDAFKGVGHHALEESKKTLKEMGRGLKEVIGLAAELGGGLSLVEGAKGAMESVSAFKNLAFQISTGTGEAVKWQEVQEDIEGAAGRWKQSTKDITQAYQQLFDETGDLKFTADATDAVTLASTASGKSMGTLASIAGVLHDKFGVAGDQMQDALASVLELGSKGGVTVEDLGEKLSIVGASAKEMGLDGADGMKQMVGMLNIGKTVLGTFRKNIKAVTDITETFGNADKMKAIEKDLHVKLTNKDGTAKAGALDAIMQKTGGKSIQLSKVFKNADTLKLVSEFGKAYQQTFSETEGTVKQKTAAATEAFHKALADAGKTTSDAASLEAEAKKRAAEDPQLQFKDAMNKLEAAFTKPQMLSAMQKLADLMPRVADGMVKILDFVMDHPALAGAAFVGAKVGAGALAGGGEKLAGNLAGMLGGAIAGGAKSLGADIVATLKGGAHSIGAAMGTAVGIAGAAAIAVAIGQALIDARIAEKEASQRKSAELGGVVGAALGTKDPKKLAEAKAKLESDYARQKSDYNSFTKSGLDPVMNLLAGAVDKDFKAPEQQQMATTLKNLDEVNAALAALAVKGTDAAKATADMGAGVKKAGQAAQQAAQQLGGVGGGQPPDTTGNGTSKGPRPPLGNAPGHAVG